MSTTNRKRLANLVAAGLAACTLTFIAGSVEAQIWRKAPGPIAGTWNVSCVDSKGMTIRFQTLAKKQAIGVVQTVGAADKYGYKTGERIFDLKADDHGDWVGKLKWRSVSGANRWEPIRLVASPTKLHATMTMDDCYTNMTRVRTRRRR